VIETFFIAGKAPFFPSHISDIGVFAFLVPLAAEPL
jgi:hypothetical protein